MDYHSPPPTFYCRPWAFNDHEGDERWTNNTMVQYPTRHELSRGTSMQPLTRYLQEPDRPLFTASATEEDITMHPFPCIPYDPSRYINSDGSLYTLQMRQPSPSTSGLSSSQVSSNMSDRGNTPYTSPNTSVVGCSTDAAYNDNRLYSIGGYAPNTDPRLNHVDPGVALPDVQAYADTQSEQQFEDDNPTYVFAQEGYQPLQSAEDDADESIAVHVCRDADEAVNGDHACEPPPVIRRRRAQSSRSITSPHSSTKVAKRPSAGRRASSHRGKVNGDGGMHQQCASNRSFPCPFATYGCNSSFGSKNEWKRHVNTQHMRLGYWRCDQCGERKPNDFNRKDLFIQHVRRMHLIEDVKTTKSRSPKTSKSDTGERCLAEAASRCFRQTRTPPERSGCLFCEASFQGPHTWDERLEHIGRHMEATKKDGGDAADPASWQADDDTEKWLAAEGIIIRHRGGWMLST